MTNDNPKPITVEQCLGEMLDCLREIRASVAPYSSLADVFDAADRATEVTPHSSAPEPLAEWEREFLASAAAATAQKRTEAQVVELTNAVARMESALASASQKAGEAFGEAINRGAVRGRRERQRGPFDDGDRVEVWIGGQRVYLGRIERPIPNDLGTDS